MLAPVLTGDVLALGSSVHPHRAVQFGGASSLVTTNEQQHIVATVLNEVDPVAGPMVNLQLGDAFANWFDGAEVPER
jgi:hypothetical protein